MTPSKKVFYTTPIFITTWGDRVAPSIKNEGVKQRQYEVEIGYIPETSEYVAVSRNDPKFYFTDKTMDEVKKVARTALEFYDKYGLQKGRNEL